MELIVLVVLVIIEYIIFFNSFKGKYYNMEEEKWNSGMC